MLSSFIVCEYVSTSKIWPGDLPSNWSCLRVEVLEPRLVPSIPKVTFLLRPSFLLHRIVDCRAMGKLSVQIALNLVFLVGFFSSRRELFHVSEWLA